MLTTPRFLRSLFATALVALPLGTGCYDADVPIGATGESGQAVACQQSSECGAGLTCQGGFCAKAPACEPVAEACNGLDDDCDGVVDDGATCPAGQACSEGACKPTGCVPAAETCNGVDDDCDGLVDDDATCPAGQACSDGTCKATGTPCGVDAQCPVGQACVSGQCQATTVCDPGFADCDGDTSNGCETDVSSDANNCGACAMVCPGGSTCQAGLCGDDPLPCQTDADCALGEACVSGQCHPQLTCDPGRRDCDADPSNGCEVDIASDASNCGACGFACVGGASCAAGVCVDAPVSCATDDDCAVGSVCVAGQCQAVVVCGDGKADCNGQAQDGCEVDLSTDVNNCGACGTSCGVGFACDAGACAALTPCGSDADCAGGQACIGGFCQ